mgnify:CR=1 FL=1
MASVIESNLTIDGNLTCQGDLMINGRVHGDVIAQNLTISEFGSLQGNIQAGKVDSNGTIAGTITAKEVAFGGHIMHTRYHQGGKIKYQRWCIDKW